MSGRLGNRSGSALLVVLGMLAFMVVSATAFSIFMRQNRLPSSFLRQRVAASMLVKAALAEAMCEIDNAIGDDPYPNEYRVSSDGNSGGWLFSTPNTGNYWRNRIYLGKSSSEGIEEVDTVSTLCLEALAYLPPPLVNTARYWSRRSPSAAWRYFDYDAGRWAFTAVNVSDYFDINTQCANVMRSSSPARLISLAYRFEDASHANLDTSRAKAFDTAMSNFVGNATYGRLVSMADYNMAMGSGKVKSEDKGSLSYESPFCKYILNAGTTAEPFYDKEDEDDIRQQTFVTDSWHPYSPRNATDLVLSDFADEDFFVSGSGKAIQGNLDELQKTAKAGTPYEKIQKRLNLPALAALYDYVDEDNVPISLAVPTIERTPQLTGIEIVPKDFKLNFKKESTKPEKIDNVTRVTHHNWKFDSVSGSFTVNLSAVFPFKRSSDVTLGNFTAHVAVKGFLTDDPAKFTTMRPAVDLRLTPDECKAQAPKAGFDSLAFFTAFGSKSVPVKSSVLKPGDTDCDCPNVSVTLNLAKADGRKVFAFSVKETYDSDAKTWVRDPASPEDDPTYMGTVPFAYVSGDGKVTPVSANSITKKSKDLSLVLLSWVRIVDGDGKTVDLAPATLTDDKLQNGIDHKLKDDLSVKLCGDGYPAFSIVSAQEVVKMAAFSEQANDVECPADLAPLSIYCNDPRYNFAPEDWYAVSGGDGIKSSTWRSNLSGVQNEDIFQFVSNCGYLQSIGEIQFLPKTGDFGAGANFNPVTGNYFDLSYDGKLGSAIGSLRHNEFMWKTYWAFGSGRDSSNDMYKWGIVDCRDGVSMSPYAANDELFMAGLANTPYDWSVADPNNGYDASMIDSLCFNSRSTEAKMEWDDLLDVGDELRELFASTAYANAATSEERDNAYANWSTWGPSGKFLGVLDEDKGIHAVDRKFLFSYWKNCYQNTQQLFLVFVRAELSMMTGSSGDRTPSQLGAKAVALVWREPTSSISASSTTTASGNKSHRMRILFYHQFE